MGSGLKSGAGGFLRARPGYLLLVLLLWLLMALPFAVLGVLAWRQVSADTEMLAKERGQSLFRLIELTREWNARRGSVYVPVDELTQPNVYLDHPQRDLPNPHGGELTMVNPAYMTRQIAELAAERTGVQFRITSLKPIRPGNLADIWEGEALRRFEREGAREQLGFFADYAIGGQLRPVHRYMAPLFVNDSCMSCHRRQGYRVGDVRGGISITMPAEGLLAYRDKRRKETLAVLLACYLITAGALHYLLLRMRRHYLTLETLNRSQEQVIAERTGELKLLNEELRHKAHHDPLTLLPNRALLRDRLGATLERASRYRCGFALLLLDLDGFKEVNDRLGHAAGDQLLVDVARRLESCVRSADTVARLGGDEFVILMSEVASGGVAEAEEIASRVVALLAEPFQLSSGDVQVSVSVGVALYPDHGRDAESLLRCADRALYTVKQEGRNGWRMCAVPVQRAPEDQPKR